MIARTLHTLEYYIINGHSIGLQTGNGRRFPWGNGGNCPRRKTPHRAPRKKGKGSPYSITERRVLELIPVLGSQPACDVSHKPGGRLSLLFARLAVTPAALKRAATNFAAW